MGRTQQTKFQAFICFCNDSVWFSFLLVKYAFTCTLIWHLSIEHVFPNFDAPSQAWLTSIAMAISFCKLITDIFNADLTYACCGRCVCTYLYHTLLRLTVYARPDYLITAGLFSYLSMISVLSLFSEWLSLNKCSKLSSLSCSYLYLNQRFTAMRRRLNATTVRCNNLSFWKSCKAKPDFWGTCT